MYTAPCYDTIQYWTTPSARSTFYPCSLKDDELASRAGLTNKDLSKLTTRLVKDGLVCVQRINNSKSGETNARVILKGYYYIDHARFCNVVKWRVAEMRKRIDSKLRNALAQQGYVCSACSKTFEPLDVAYLSRGDAFYCDDCGHELVDNSSAADEEGRKDRMERFNAQTQRIRDGLKKTEEMVMPKVDIQDWIRRHPIITGTADGEVKQEDGLAIAGAKPGVTQKQEYQVVLTVDDAEEKAAKAAREREASKRKVQNIMPSWHTQSTVTGELTSFGIKNATIAGSFGDMDTQEEEKDVKPNLDHEKVKQSVLAYYAKRNEEEKAAEAANGGRPPDGGIRSVLDRTFSTSSLKRKLEEADADDPRSLKHSRTVSYQSSLSEPKSKSSPGLSEFPGLSEAALAKGEPTVMVCGLPVLLSKVTEADHEKMTLDEYSIYAELVTG